MRTIFFRSTGVDFSQKVGDRRNPPQSSPLKFLTPTSPKGGVMLIQTVFMFMNKREQAKKKKELKDYLIKEKLYVKSDDILIGQLIDWMAIDAHAKSELTNDPNNWVTVSTISVASKNIQQLMTKLSLTPQIRNSKIKIEVEKPIALEDV